MIPAYSLGVNGSRVADLVDINTCSVHEGLHFKIMLRFLYRHARRMRIRTIEITDVNHYISSIHKRIDEWRQLKVEIHIICNMDSFQNFAQHMIRS